MNFVSIIHREGSLCVLVTLTLFTFMSCYCPHYVLCLVSHVSKFLYDTLMDYILKATTRDVFIYIYILVNDFIVLLVEISSGAILGDLPMWLQR